MNKRKLGSFAPSVMLLALGVSAPGATDGGKIHRIGFLIQAPLPAARSSWEAFRQELNKLGWD